MLGDLPRHSPQLVVQLLAVGQVALERLLDADRDPLRSKLQPARIDAARPVAEQRPDLSGEEAAQLFVVERGELAARRDPGHAQALVGLRPHARELPHRERSEEPRLRPGHDHRQSAWLAPVARHLGDDLRGRDADGAREARRRAHGGLHRFGDGSGGEEIARDLAEIEVALVEARALDGRHDPPHRRPHRARVLAVDRVPRADERGVRAPP